MRTKTKTKSPTTANSGAIQSKLKSFKTNKTMKFSSEILKSAWKIVKLTSFTWAESIKEAIRQAIKVKEAFLKGLVMFFKSPLGDEEVEVVTRRIKSLAWFGYESKGDARKTDTIKAVDLDKYEATGNISTSIISFHGYQIL